jgi:hypothetical protein
MIKTLVKNELLESKYFKNTTMGATSLAQNGSKAYSDLRD